MTQFLLATGSYDSITQVFSDCVPLSKVEQFFLDRSADFLAASEVEASWLVSNADHLFMEAVSQAGSPDNFASTALAKKLEDLAKCSKQIAIWYAADSSNLEVVTTSQDLLDRIGHQLFQSGNEVYVQFRAGRGAQS